MKTNEQNNYQSPVTEVYEIDLEHLLCNSPNYSMEDLGDEKDPIGW